MATTRTADGLQQPRPGPDVDAWGFYVDSMPWHALPSSKAFISEQEALDRKRDRKWAQMTHHAQGLEVYCSKPAQRKKLKERVRKGVPRAWRRAIWPALLEVEVKERDEKESIARGAASFRAQAAREGITYSMLCTKTMDAGRQSVYEEIERDLCRTYPRHRLFDSKIIDGGGADRAAESQGVASLRRVLRAYAELDSDTQYCQGMNSVAALLIVHVCDDDTIDAARRSVNDPMPIKRSINDEIGGRQPKNRLDGSAEEDAFWLFVAALRAPRTNLRDLYGPGMVGACKALRVFNTLLERINPKLHAHLAEQNCYPDMFATHWIVTIFAAQFPFALVARVWDMFLAEGWKPVYRVAVALVAAYEAQLLAKDFEQLLIFLRQLPSNVDVDKVLKCAAKLSFPKTSAIQKYESQSEPSPDEQAQPGKR